MQMHTRVWGCPRTRWRKWTRNKKSLPRMMKCCFPYCRISLVSLRSIYFLIGRLCGAPEEWNLTLKMFSWKVRDGIGDLQSARMRTEGVFRGDHVGTLQKA